MRDGGFQLADLAGDNRQQFVDEGHHGRVGDQTGLIQLCRADLGKLAQAGDQKDALRKAMIYGSVMGSFAVEEFGTKRIQGVTREEVETRAKAILDMLRV